MKLFLTKLLDFSLVRWVVNKKKGGNEKSRYLLVSHDDGDYLFTQAEASKAKERAKKNPEDNFKSAKFID
jgi:general stress protein 26